MSGLLGVCYSCVRQVSATLGTVSSLILLRGISTANFALEGEVGVGEIN